MMGRLGNFRKRVASSNFYQRQSERAKNVYSNVKKKTLLTDKAVTVIGIILAVFTFIWSWVMGGANSGLLLGIINSTLVAVAIIWKFPFTLKTKFIMTLVFFAPLIIFSVYSAMTIGGAFFGNLIDQAQHTLLNTKSTGPSVIDMILNPKLAIQAGMKPPSEKAVTEGDVNPKIAFSVSGEVIPANGCYDSTNYQVIARLKNTGDIFISDILLKMDGDPDNPLACGTLSFTGDHEWRINSIPKTVTITKSSVVNPIPVPPVDNAGDNIASAHACFVDLTAETGYHGLTRLPLQFIDSDYARSLYERGLLKQDVIPSTTSAGPVDLSIGGINQPIYNFGSSSFTIPLITTFSNVGDGFVNSFESVVLFIPSSVLADDDCSNSNDNWRCLTKSDFNNNYLNCDSLVDNLLDSEGKRARDLCNNFNKFINDQKIGDYSQFAYDGSVNLLDDGYSVCFYSGEINTDGTNTGVCTLTINSSSIINSLLRKTLIIRGDILYVYQSVGEATINVKDCDVT